MATVQLGTTDGVRLRVSDEGDGPTVLLARLDERLRLKDRGLCDSHHWPCEHAEASIEGSVDGRAPRLSTAAVTP